MSVPQGGCGSHESLLADLSRPRAAPLEVSRPVVPSRAGSAPVSSGGLLWSRRPRQPAPSTSSVGPDTRAAQRRGTWDLSWRRPWCCQPLNLVPECWKRCPGPTTREVRAQSLTGSAGPAGGHGPRRNRAPEPISPLALVARPDVAPRLPLRPLRTSPPAPGAGEEPFSRRGRPGSVCVLPPASLVSDSYPRDTLAPDGRWRAT